ncbi:MAG: hypothetical protein NZ879_04535 [Archaeoglobaceae archaeon]|nr:hypothetical protein [Archaeoglobaceae archaeon]MDW8118230.1 hypothetical protein [Archaeoglobaceae archaeon]
MILLVIAIVSTFSVPQGGSFNLTLSDQGYVELDPCMFFEDAKSSGNYSPGDYRVIASYGCDVGRKEILIRSQKGVERILIDVEKGENVNQKIVEIQKEAILTKRQLEELSQRRDYLQSLVAVLNDINVQLYDKNKELAEKNNILASELDKTKLDLENCSKNFTNLEKRIGNMQTLLDSAKIELDHCSAELASIKNFLSNSSFYLDVFKNLAILALAFVVGIFLAMLRRY